MAVFSRMTVYYYKTKVLILKHKTNEKLSFIHVYENKEDCSYYIKPLKIIILLSLEMENPWQQNV